MIGIIVVLILYLILYYEISNPYYFPTPEWFLSETSDVGLGLGLFTIHHFSMICCFNSHVEGVCVCDAEYGMRNAQLSDDENEKAFFVFF